MSTGTAAPAKRDVRGEAFVVFAVIRGFAELVHYTALGWVDPGPATVLLVAASAVLILRPTIVALLTVSVLDVVRVVVDSPYTTNHVFYNGLVNLTIVVALGSLLIDRREQRLEARAFSTFAPLLRGELVLIYLVAAFHKLNADFFDAVAGCGAFITNDIGSRVGLPAVTGTLASATSVGGLAVELALPLLLLSRRTRNVGLVVGLGFHFAIGLSSNPGIYSFSAFVFGMYVVFLPLDRLASVLDMLRERSWWRHAQVAKLAAMAWIVGIGMLGFRWAAWVPAAVAVTVFILAVLAAPSERREPTEPAVSRRRLLSVAVVPMVLMVLNSAGPYVGLHTMRAMTMFSNIATEGGASNHFIVPADVQIFDYQTDLVEVVSSSSTRLQGHADRGELLPFVEFYRIVASNRPSEVTFVRADELVVLRATDDAAVVDALDRPSWFALHMMGFRPVDQMGPVQCRH